MAFFAWFVAYHEHNLWILIMIIAIDYVVVVGVPPVFFSLTAFRVISCMKASHSNLEQSDLLEGFGEAVYLSIMFLLEGTKTPISIYVCNVVDQKY